jgi:hypothetical protein
VKFTGGFPGVADCAQLQIGTATVQGTTTVADEVWSAAAVPIPIPNGKHWIVHHATLWVIGDEQEDEVSGIYITNNKLPQNNSGPIFTPPGATIGAREAQFYNFLAQNQAVAIHDSLSDIRASLPGVASAVFMKAIPYAVVPQGCIFAAIWQPKTAGAAFQIILNFIYEQRDNSDC